MSYSHAIKGWAAVKLKIACPRCGSCLFLVLAYTRKTVVIWELAWCGWWVPRRLPLVNKACRVCMPVFGEQGLSCLDACLWWTRLAVLLSWFGYGQGDVKSREPEQYMFEKMSNLWGLKNYSILTIQFLWSGTKCSGSALDLSLTAVTPPRGREGRCLSYVLRASQWKQ